jgi:hypothetical protein
MLDSNEKSCQRKEHLKRIGLIMTSVVWQNVIAGFKNIINTEAKIQKKKNFNNVPRPIPPP